MLLLLGCGSKALPPAQAAPEKKKVIVKDETKEPVAEEEPIKKAPKARKVDKKRKTKVKRSYSFERRLKRIKEQRRIIMEEFKDLEERSKK